MTMVAVEYPWLDQDRGTMEALIALKCAGAARALSYFAPAVAWMLREG